MNFSNLTKKKKFFLLGLSIITILGIFFLFWILNSKNTPQSNPSETLTAQRQQILTETKKKLTSHQLTENKLCQKLKEKHPNINIDNLNSYLQTAKSAAELNTLHQEIKNTIAHLIQPPIPGPSPSPSPSPSPDSEYASGLLDDRAMEIIIKEWNLKTMNNDLEIIAPAAAENIKFGKFIKPDSLEEGKEKEEIIKAIENYKKKKIIFLPVNNNNSPNHSGSGGHWSLLVCDVPAKSFYYYDSMKGDPNFEWGEKLKKKFKEILNWKVAETTKKQEGPRQKDGDSCGGYVVANIRFLVERYNNNSSVMKWEISPIETKVHDSILEIRKILKQKGWTDTGGGGLVIDEYDSWAYSDFEHRLTTLFLEDNNANNEANFNSFQQHIRNKFPDKSEANKLIKLGLKIGKINDNFKKKNKDLVLKISQIILVLKLFAGDKDNINQLENSLNGDNPQEIKKKKFFEEKKALIAEDYVLTEKDKEHLDKTFDENIINDFLEKI